MKNSMPNIENVLFIKGSDQINPLPTLTVVEPENQTKCSRKSILDKLVEHLNLLAYKLLPEHLTSTPPPDRQIYY